MTSLPPNSGGETPQPVDKQITLQDILIPIWANRKPILIISCVVALITLLVNFFLLPVYYKATATLLPETQKDKLSSLGQFADIAQIAGVNVSGSEIARLYGPILNSETVLRNVVLARYRVGGQGDSVDLIRYFGYGGGTPEEQIAKSLKELRELMSTSFEAKTSIVTVTLEMRDPQLAADVLNRMIGELDMFMRQKRLTNATEQRTWIDGRLREVERELRGAEEGLKTFREKNRRTADSPELLLIQERLAREVQLKSTIYIELKKQYELARIDEIKNLSVINVLDPGRPPVRKERPKRATNTAVALLLSMLAGSGAMLAQSLYGRKVGNVINTIRQK